MQNITLSINRNIVECKDGCRDRKEKKWQCINRNIVECKGKNIVAIQEICSVLIETSWNVKFSTESFLDCVVSVLIETSWNVKACSPSNNLTAISINRNIVECKERSWICCMKRDRGINRNIVECKGTVG